MSALDLLQALSQVAWVAVAAISVVRAIRRPARTNVDTALFSAAIGSVLVYSRLAALLALPSESLITFLVIAVLMAAPYLLLRLIDDFAGVPRIIRRAAEIGLALSMVA